MQHQLQKQAAVKRSSNKNSNNQSNKTHNQTSNEMKLDEIKDNIYCYENRKYSNFKLNANQYQLFLFLWLVSNV